MKTARQIETGNLERVYEATPQAAPERIGRPPEVSPEAVEQGLRRAHELRSEAAWTIGGALWSAVHRGLGTLVERVARAQRIHDAIRELDALNDRTLSDIGVSRAEIPLVARGLHQQSVGREARDASGSRPVVEGGLRHPVAAANDDCCAQAA